MFDLLTCRLQRFCKPLGCLRQGMELGIRKSGQTGNPAGDLAKRLYAITVHKDQLLPVGACHGWTHRRCLSCHIIQPLRVLYRLTQICSRSPMLIDTIFV
eukprot:3861761-Amphidinium_carterae.1